MNRWRHFLTLLVLLAVGAGASGYALLGSKWNFSPVTMHLELGSSGTLLDGFTSWNSVASGALATWNHYLLRLQFTPVIDSNTPANNDGINNVFFSSTIYGKNFGDAVAVTTEFDLQNNSAVRREADVMFNSALSWNSYRGPLRTTTSGDTLYDLRRVALHEFGHVVGLDHPDEHGQTVVAVMNSHVSDVDDLQADDIEGGQFLYGAQPGTFIGDVVTVTRPARKGTTSTSAANYLLLGTADTDQALAVFLVNSRVSAKRFFKAKGISSWKATLPLKPGRNLVKIYIRTPEGFRKKVTTRVLTLTSD